MTMLAAAAKSGDSAGFLLAAAVLLGVGYFVVSLFKRRIGGKKSGSDTEAFGAWLLLAAILVGVLVASGR